MELTCTYVTIQMIYIYQIIYQLHGCKSPDLAVGVELAYYDRETGKLEDSI